MGLGRFGLHVRAGLLLAVSLQDEVGRVTAKDCRRVTGLSGTRGRRAVNYGPPI